MARNIVIVNATQVVTSETNPQGLLSTVSGYPKIFDSRSYNDDVELTMNAAKTDYYNRLGQNYADTNPNRIMKTVVLEMADGRQILKDCIGGFATEIPAADDNQD